MGILADITGRQFGWLLVLNRSTTARKNRLAYWDCECTKCKTVLTVRSDELRNGTKTSCANCRHQFTAHATFQEFYDGEKL